MDQLASEYGWAKGEILDNVYFDELVFLLSKIKKRKLTDYRIQLMIVQNPHTKKPEDLWKLLQDDEEIPHNDNVLDEKGMEELKRIMSKGRAIQVK